MAESIYINEVQQVEEQEYVTIYLPKEQRENQVAIQAVVDAVLVNLQPSQILGEGETGRLVQHISSFFNQPSKQDCVEESVKNVSQAEK